MKGEFSNLTAGRKMTARLQRAINWTRTDKNSNPLTNSLERKSQTTVENTDFKTFISLVKIQITIL